jgi:hypothetical protein
MPTMNILARESACLMWYECPLRRHAQGARASFAPSNPARFG